MSTAHHRNHDNHRLSKSFRKSCRDGEIAKVQSILNRDEKSLEDKAEAEEAISLREVILSKDGRGWTGLHLATLRNHLQVCRTILEFVSNHQIEEGEDFLLAVVNAQTNEKSTPLIVACYNGRFDAATLLLENGADTSILDHVGDTAQVIAQARGKSRLGELLKRYHQSHQDDPKRLRQDQVENE
jgi:ankyrin repeat protein